MPSRSARRNRPAGTSSIVFDPFAGRWMSGDPIETSMPCAASQASHGSLVLGQQLPDGKARQDSLIAPQCGIVRVVHARVGGDVGVAEQGRLVAGAAGGAREVVVPVVERRAVAADAVVHLVEPGIDAGACRRAGRGIGKMAQEHRALAGKPVDIRRLHDLVSGDPERVAPPLVASDEQDVGTRLPFGHEALRLNNLGMIVRQ